MVELWERKFIARAELDAAVSQLAVAEGRYQDAIEEVRNRQAIMVQRRSELEIVRQQFADTRSHFAFRRRRQRTPGFCRPVPAGRRAGCHARAHRSAALAPGGSRERSWTGAHRTSVNLSVEGDPKKYQGRVARLSPAIAENNRTLMIEAEVPNRQGALRPGSFAKADIVVQAGQHIVTVPADSIITFAGIEKVLMVVGGKAVEKRVSTGRRIGEQVEVIEGIAAGNQVIVQPGNLVSGEPVTVMN